MDAPVGNTLLNSGDGQMNRTENSEQLLQIYAKNENLRKHALAVEICVRAYAREVC